MITIKFTHNQTLQIELHWKNKPKEVAQNETDSFELR